MQTHWKKFYNYEYLGDYSIPEGKELHLTIKSAGFEEVIGKSGKKEQCLVCHFREPSKPMILNRTNCRIISQLHKSSFVEDWRGKKIAIYVQKGVKAFGETVDALRVRPFMPKANPILELKTAINTILKSFKANENALKDQWIAKVKALKKPTEKELTTILNDLQNSRL